MTEPRWLDETEALAWRGYLRMHELLRARLERELGRDSGLSYTDYQVLVELSEVEGLRLRMTELATRLVWSKSRLSHQITRMSKRGLVGKEDCDSDARGSFAVLTPAGLEAITVAAPNHVQAVRHHFLDRLSLAQLEHLIEINSQVAAPLAE
ncbi:MAG: MarR family winged helix-turn-helix transcriptional regulator [Sciscionella sp.]